MQIRPYDAPEASSPFEDTSIISLLAELVNGNDQSVIIESGEAIIRCPSIVIDRAVTTGDPTCVMLPRYEGPENYECRKRAYQLAIEYHCDSANIVELRVDPAKPQNLRPWLEAGFTLSNNFTTIIKLQGPDAVRLGRMRRRFPSYIRSMQRRQGISHYHAASPNCFEGIDRWIALYHVVTERANAAPSAIADETTKCAVLSGALELFCIERDGEMLSAVAAYYGASSAYYGQGATLPGHERGEPLSHILIWKAIQRAKERGLEYFEIGPVFFGGERAALSPKAIGIANFKLGFGGDVVPWPIVRWRR